ncbi:MAG: hypothetical protein JSS07_12615 [Proteobacteria bacterium]|nr:hypothetical protein [Pseudomonadota bacterium]
MSQFCSIVLPWATKFGALEEACFAALLCTFMFGILDAVGLKFLWWTWHNSDVLYQDRVMGVPIVSAFWIMASTLALSFVIRLIVRSDWFRNANIVAVSLTALIAGPFATVVIMNIPFVVFYHPLVTFLGFSAALPLFLLRLVCAIIVARALWARKRKFSPDAVFYMAFVYISIFAAVTVCGTPEAVRRTSYSQPFGACEATESSFWGAFNRSQYVCPEAVNAERDQYSFSCLDTLPVGGSNWYTVCGIPFYPTWWRDIIWYFGGGLGLVVLSQLRPVHDKRS